jgi:hypothetical protein
MRASLQAAAGLLVLFLGLYGLTFHGFVDIEDTEVCYQSTASFVERGTLAIGDTDMGRRIVEARFQVAPGPDGAMYPIYPLAQLLLPVPFYCAGQALAPWARERPEDVVRMSYASIDVLVGALLSVVIFALARQLGFAVRVAGACALLAGTCTMLWAYAQGTFPDPWVALLIAVSTSCLLRAGKHGPRRSITWLLAAGAAHGVAAAIRPAGLLLLLAVVLHLRDGKKRDLLAFLVPVATVLGGIAAVDAFVLHRPFAASYAARAAAEAPLLTHSYTLGVAGLLISAGKGLFALSPVLLLAVLSFPALHRRHPRTARLFAGHLLVLVAFFAAFAGWDGGWCWGPRYLLPCVPLVAVAMAPWLALPGRLRRALTVLLVAVSLWIQVLSIAVPHRIYMTAISRSPNEITHFYFYPRYGPIRAHQKILLQKLTGGGDEYSLRALFGLPDDAAFDAARVPNTDISRYSAGFDHFAWVRVFRKGYPVAACLAVLACALSMLLGYRLYRRAGATEPAPEPVAVLRAQPST